METWKDWIQFYTITLGLSFILMVTLATLDHRHEITVQEGDNLWHLAELYEAKQPEQWVENVKVMNGLFSDTVYATEKLTVPGKERLIFKNHEKIVKNE